MPLPDHGYVAVQGGSTDPKPAHLIRFPDSLWPTIVETVESGGKLMMSLGDGVVSPPSLAFALPAQCEMKTDYMSVPRLS